MNRRPRRLVLAGLSAALLAAAAAPGAAAVRAASARQGSPPRPPARPARADTTPSDTTPAAAAAADTTPADTAAGQEKPPKIRPYRDVVPATAERQEGVFAADRVGDTLYYEIPREELGAPFLLVSRIARAQTGTGYGGQKLGTRVVRWTRHGDRVLLRSVSYEIVADSTTPIYRAVKDATLEPVIAAFDVEAFGPDSSFVIDVTSLFTTDVPELSPRKLLGASSLDSRRSFLESVRAFPRNLEVEAMLTYSADTVSAYGFAPNFANPPRVGTISVVVHHSMVRLPDRPMRPRLADDRVGYFEVQQYDFGRDEDRAPRRRLITRWRLEKKDPSAAVSEPVHPIVFYVDRATPEKWRKWIVRAVEDWQPAFEAAGFRNAIVARMAPSEAEDPDFSPEDARYSVIRWLPSSIENARGPNVHDPRSGQVLEADIQVYHNVLKLARDWYFVQAGAADPRARRLPLPDSLEGRLIEYVVSHEVGHTLGLPHNMKASSAYPVDSLRSATFTARHGDEASIMDYGRFNYVAQPGDGASLVPVIGPYDRFAVMWGYRPIPGTAGPEAERDTLDAWARRQEGHPELRFGPGFGADPSAQMEDLGDDHVEATRLGLKNLRRVSGMLLEATGRPGRSYDELEDMYRSLVRQWSTELRHVVDVVGGVYETRKHYGQEGVVHAPVPAGRQRRAVDFVLEHAFHVPDFLVERDVVRRFEAWGSVDRIEGEQASLLEDLLSDDRLRRLGEAEALAGPGGDAYPPGALLDTVRAGLFSELRRGGEVRIGPYRRSLQRAWVRILTFKLQADSDIGALARGELEASRDRIEDAGGRAGDRITRLHLEDLARRIERALQPPAGGS
ncbi:MAG TPA: zinc-dependent metalloprotease [Gemmatimonadota bacterium]|nr:zinc-dependent metalloprotease [Gemmatimonadota bacterium]